MDTQNPAKTHFHPALYNANEFMVLPGITQQCIKIKDPSRTRIVRRVV